MSTRTITDQAIAQLQWHWDNQLRPRLDGLSDAEYLWQPVPGCWSVRPAGTARTPMAAGGGAMEVDFAFPPPDPAPVTTIAWRLAHVIVGVLAVRSAGHFDGPEADYFSWEYAATATEALDQLDTEYRRWLGGLHTLDDAALRQPCGEAEGPFAAEPMLTLVLHINREIIHHGAEVALLRDLFAHRSV